MRARLFVSHSVKWIFLAFSVIFLQVSHGSISADAADQLSAEVTAVQGQAYIVGAQEVERQPLSRGSTVPPWTAVRTDDNSKLLLQWWRGLLTSMGSVSTLFMSSRKTQDGSVPDMQLIEGAVRVSTREGGRGPWLPYALTTPVVRVEPVSFDSDVDFVAETFEPTATVVTVLKGPVRIRSLSVQDSREMIVESCNSVYVEQGKPISNVSPVSSDAVERLVTETTIPGTQIAQVQACGVGRIAQVPEQEYSLPPHYVYIPDDDFVDWYPYSDIQVFPPETASGPIIIFLPGIGRWYLPYQVYHVWGFGPDVIRVYVTLALSQSSLYYDQYDWNDSAVREREYYDVLYAAQLAGNTRLIAQTQRQLDYLRVRQDLMARRIHHLQAKIGSLETALPRRGHASGTILAALTNSLNSPQNIDVARSLRQRVKNDLHIQKQLAGNATEELLGLRARLAQARDPQDRMHLRQSLSQLRGSIREGKLPLPEKQGEVKSLLEQLPKARKPEQLDSLQNELVRRLGKPTVMQESGVIDPARLNELKQHVEKTAGPEERKQVVDRLQNLQKTRQQREEIESARKKMDEMISRAAETQDEAKRAELLNQAHQLAKPGVSPLWGPLPAVREQQRRNQIVGTREKEQQQELMQRKLERTGHQPGKVPQPPGLPPAELHKRGEGPPTQAERLRRHEAELKKQADENRRKAEELRRQKQQGASQAERQRLQDLDRQNKARLERQRQVDQAKRQAEERAKALQRQNQLRTQREQVQRAQQQKLHEQQLQQQRLQQQRQQEQRQLQQQKALEQQRLQQRRMQEQQKLQQQRQQQEQRLLLQRQQEQQRLQQQRILERQRKRVPVRPVPPDQKQLPPPLH
jgi:hypothetical protein